MLGRIPTVRDPFKLLHPKAPKSKTLKTPRRSQRRSPLRRLPRPRRVRLRAQGRCLLRGLGDLKGLLSDVQGGFVVEGKKTLKGFNLGMFTGLMVYKRCSGFGFKGLGFQSMEAQGCRVKVV